MSTVILDTITGKSTATTITIGSTPVVSASANSMTIRGEGSNQTSIQQGLAKQWIQFDFSSFTIDDSLNVASVADVGVGRSQINATNAFGSVHRAGASQGSYESGTDGSNNYNTTTTYIRNSTNTSQNYMNFFNRDGTLQDGTNASGAMFGDLS